MTTPLLDLDGFKTRTPMPSADVDAVEADSPGFILSRLTIWTSRIYSRLAKRYAVPFSDVTTAPEIVVGWLVACVTPEAYRKRGWNPSDEQVSQVEQDRKDALDELKEAADSNEGLFDIPLRSDTDASGVSKGGPLSYSEASPYSWIDMQLETILGGGS